METIAKLRHLRMAPRKVRLLIDLIRGSKVTDAVVQLELSTKQAAKPVLKLLQSAVANAKHNHDLLSETLMIKKAYVDDGVTLHRWRPAAMGRATPLRKRSAHVTIVLEGEVDSKSKRVKKQEKDKKAKTSTEVVEKKENTEDKNK